MEQRIKHNLHPDLLRGEENNEIKVQSRNKENAGRRYKNAGKVLSLGLILATQGDNNS
jgi:hypothetical protein